MVFDVVHVNLGEIFKHPIVDAAMTGVDNFQFERGLRPLVDGIAGSSYVGHSVEDVQHLVDPAQIPLGFHQSVSEFRLVSQKNLIGFGFPIAHREALREPGRGGG